MSTRSSARLVLFQNRLADLVRGQSGSAIFFFHQANLRINEAVADLLKIPQEKIFNTIQKYGNTTAATIPLGMDDAQKEGRLKPGMLVATAAFGSGFTWGSNIFRF